ncbi:uncharacterized protein LOC134531309 [Bacillus rossius redtenbacheri]|uniref:uncharacterized protein LOC134531309 n=1 Tax=Bacillus rossius redtenbacheri TaxID=93214 RepID=UPI002FDDBF6A
MASWALYICALAVTGTSLAEVAERSSAVAPTVKVTQGTLRGSEGRSADGTTFYKFQGIPYAKPPVGSLRFVAPQEPVSWSGVREATSYGNHCLQTSEAGGSEDCLYLNVFTPQLPAGTERAALLPVMVFIHGGAFVAGSGNTGPGQLVDHGVVVVTINYRLNLFGFMSIEGTDAPGNAGLKDQVAGLKWVKKNIEHFGGNPNSVTIFGVSAGGASVQYQLLSSMSRGLFHKAISESGYALNSFAYVPNTQQSAFELSKLVGKPATTTSQLIRNLREVPASDLIKALPKVSAPKGYTRPFVPCIEFARSGEVPFMRHSPASLVKAGLFTSVPYIIGTAKREVAAFYSEASLASEALWKSVNGNWEAYVVPTDLGLTLGSQKSKEVAEKVKKFYFGNSAVSYQTREKWISLQTDLQFTIGAVTTLRAHAKHSTSHTYNYWLTYGAATHGMEWSYVFYNGQVKGQTSSAAKLAWSLGQLWTNFAKTGVPTAAGEVTWKPVSTSSYPYLDIDVPNTLKTDVEKEQMDFWFQIYAQYHNGTVARAFQLSSLVGRPANTTSQLVRSLRAASAGELIAALDNVTAPQSYVRPFGPCTEFPRAGEEPFLSRAPAGLVLGGHFTSVPYVIGTTKRENALNYPEELLASDAFWKHVHDDLEDYFVPIELGLATGSPESKEVARRAQLFYFGNETLAVAGSWYSTSRTYNYWLTYGNATSTTEWDCLTYGGRVQGETAGDAVLARTLGEYWTSFAKTGVPTAAGEVTWKPVSTSSYPYLDIDVPNTLKTDVRKEQIDFWEDIYKNYHNASRRQEQASISGATSATRGRYKGGGLSIDCDSPGNMAVGSPLLAALLCVLAAASGQQSTVKIPQGSLRGASAWTSEGTKYYKFLGIPYAKPPVGNLRFAAPQDPASWSGERDATNFGSMCTQDTGGSEDCLFMNVFTPQVPSSRSNATLRPVMVYIHGGAFVTGSGNIGPGQLIDRGMVVASMNYRLNVFGFLRVDYTDATGNAGLKDQTAALKWVQKNIAEFGGNPNDVTIFGVSAGGASVHYHVLSPLSKGLFQRAISESGSALNPWAFAKNTNDRSYRLSYIIGKEAHSAAACVQNLRAASASELTSALNRVLTADESTRLISVPFIPSLEFQRSGEQQFLPHEPSYIEQNGLFNNVPYILGATKREGASFVSESSTTQSYYWQAINNDLERVVPVDLGLTKGSQKSKEVAQKVKSFYFGNQAISYETREKWINLQTDLLIALGIVRTVHYHVKHSTSTYNYHFVYGDALHGAESAYVFYGGKMQGQNSDAVKLARLMGELWTSFARAGAPSAQSEPAWKPASQNSFPYYEINVSPALKYNMEKENMDFWFNIYNTYSNYTSTL